MKGVIWVGRGVTERVPEDLGALAECERSRPIQSRSFGARAMQFAKMPESDAELGGSTLRLPGA